MADDNWFYAVGGQQQGPVTLAVLRGWLAAGQIQSEDLVWREGMPSWLSASTVPELADAVPVSAQPAVATPAWNAGGAAAAGFATGGAYGGPPPEGQIGYYNAAQGYGVSTNYAGFWYRFVAYIIDYIVLYIPSFLIQSVLTAGVQSVSSSSGGARPGPGGVPPAVFALMGVSFAISMTMGWLYYALMETSSKQGTLGKMAMGIIVTDMQGKRLTFGRASGRFFGKLLSGIICCVGYMMAGWTEKKQALHDQLAGTLVVRRGM
jgi:uncharacterized RDD family membrane protein YckC